MNPETMTSGWQNLAAFALLVLAALDMLRRLKPTASFSSFNSNTAGVCLNDQQIPDAAPKVCSHCSACSLKNAVTVQLLNTSSDG